MNLSFLKRIIQFFITLVVVMPASVWAVPYGSGTYGACTYDTCGITLTTNGTLNLSLSPTPSGVYTIQKDDASVTTGADTGYTLTLESSVASTTLADGTNTIAASAGTPAAPIVLAMNTWGYRIDGFSGFGVGPTSAVTSVASSTLTFAGLTANGSPATVASTTTAATSEITTVWYGVRVDSSLTPGTYSRSVTYTATTNP